MKSDQAKIIVANLFIAVFKVTQLGKFALKPNSNVYRISKRMVKFCNFYFKIRVKNEIWIFRTIAPNYEASEDRAHVLNENLR